MKKLVEKIRKAEEAYRKGEPIMSDSEFDELIDTLVKLDPNNELLKRGVIENETKNRKQKLPLPMYSLNKVKSFDELIKWMKSKGIEDQEKMIITPKLDGISLVVDEKNDSCWTRGDGEFGQRSDEHYSVLSQYYNESELITFGEAIMSKSIFSSYTNQFATARNMVAGLFNRDVAAAELQEVDYIRYGSNLDSHKIDKNIQLDRLNMLNKARIDYQAWVYSSSNDMMNEEFLDILYNKWSENYQIDGLVVEFNSGKRRSELGREENMNPAYAVAIKFPKWSSNAQTKVKGITWGVSKQGKLKPVIQITPTEINGVTITNITGYNAKYIFDNNISKRAIIEITRSGDVIPKHLKTLGYLTSEIEDVADSITECPSCGKQTVWDETYTELLCTNPNCKEKQISKLIHFFNTIGVEEFGEPSIRQFYEANYTTISSIMNMDTDDICSLSGWGVKSATKLIDQFANLVDKGISTAKLLHALDVFEGKLGEKDCQLIFDNISVDVLYSFLGGDLSVEDLISIKGVGEITAKWFKIGINKFLTDPELGSVPVNTTHIETPKKTNSSNKYDGFMVCMTGFRDDKLSLQIIDGGGKIVSGVSKNTTHLLVKDLGSTSSKMKKAQELGIDIMTVEMFKEL